MHLRLLGTAAGGGFPQWNCACANCVAVRDQSHPSRPRTQSSAAVSADGKRWFLVNASPDLRIQIEAFPPLLPGPGVKRGTGVQGVLLTNADLDHVLGIYLLREGPPLQLHASLGTRFALTEGLHISDTLGHYNGLVWHEPPTELTPLLCGDGSPSGLLYSAFPIPGKLPRYMGDAKTGPPGDSVGYRIVDEATGGRLVVMPDVSMVDDIGLAEMQNCDVLLFDGTLWTDDEMIRMGVGTARASDMAHMYVGGPAGSLATLSSLTGPRKIYMHINNTNPMLLEDSPEFAEVKAVGCEVGWDGLELTI